jgi:two-component system probable response regulator PhcQ
MLQPDDYKRFPILYVDDESQALKYFRKAMEKDFEILTAENTTDAGKILEEHGDRIGILVCDQRMPGEKGTDLLARVRQGRPGIIRILTTAYSDLDSAIEAVNSGAIYKYIVKPWDLRDLRGVLLRAMDFHVIQRQRDKLLREKLTVLQRMMVVDRVRSLAVLAAGLSHHIRNSMAALKAFLDLAPAKLRDELDDGSPRNPAFWTDLWEIAQKESRKILQLVDGVAANVVHPSADFSTVEPMAKFLGDSVKSATDRGLLRGCKVRIAETGKLPDLHIDRALSQRMMDGLLEKAAEINGGNGTISIAVEAGGEIAGTAGVKVFITGDAEGWKTARSEQVFAPVSTGTGMHEMLVAFFIAFHHGGELLLGADGSGRQRLELVLPYDPMSAAKLPEDPAFLDQVFSMFDMEQLNAAG